MEHKLQKSRVRRVLIIQSVYYGITALWPLIDINSFMEITGPKTDIWLVYTVAALLLAITFSFIVAIFKGINHTVVGLAVSSAIALTCIDIVFVFKDVISGVYLLDAVAEIILLVAWLLAFLFRK